MAIISTSAARDLIKNTGNILLHSASDLLASSDFVSRTIGMTNSYESLMLLVQSLGREPVSLLGKDYLFIFDHVRRNYEQGTTISSVMYGVDGGNYWCPKFTFYKEKPTVRFANPYADNLNLLDRWFPNFSGNNTKSNATNFFYAESNDGSINNKTINNAESNMGTASGQYSTSFQNLSSCDLIKKTNANFNNGKFNTLVARFHTNLDDTMDPNNPTQTAISKTYGMSHGRNLLKLSPTNHNSYDNPYCRVWTYHHQYHTIEDAIRPFDDARSAGELEEIERGDYDTVGFRTMESKNYGIKGGSERLDTHGVLNYDNGFVNIAPTAKIKDYFEHKADDKDRKSVSIKKCMFSIENLAWRDEKAKYDQFEAYGLSAEQRGPLGGRIMWFPPYDISFNESVSVKWNSNEFIGRGENIYTYTNTERRGNLSFTLVIDHPSILDYWTGHERNGMKNQGMDLLPGNTNGVDGKDNQENTLLRFFAGCDILTAKPQKYWMRNTTPENAPGGKKGVENENTGKSDENKGKKGGNVLCCILYYPNNYSGVDDRKKSASVNPIYYLMNGIGAQKTIGNDNLPVDISTQIQIRPKVGDTEYGGYELTKGISVATQVLNGKTAEQKSYYVDDETNKYKEEAQLITDAEGNAYTVEIGTNSEIELAKIVCTKPPKKSDKNKRYYTYNEAGNKFWPFMRWYYRVDKDYEHHCLTHPESYIDSTCYALNGSGYEKVKTTEMPKKLNVPDRFTLIPFSALFNVLEGKSVVEGNEYGVNDETTKLIRDIKEGKNGYKITKVSFRGHASTAGYKNSNEKLSNDRRDTLKNWFTEKFPKERLNGVKIETLPFITQSDNNNVNYGNANEPDQKIWRSASVMIEYELSGTENARTQDTLIGMSNDILTQALTKTDLKIYNDPEAVDWLYKTEEGRQIREYGIPTTVITKDANGRTIEKVERKSVDLTTFTKADIARLTGKDYFNTASTEYDDSYLNKGISVDEKVVKRYDNEGEFFELLDKKSPFLHHLITDKIRYFDPAYHAISPEGFNARLTFLHQCTRQGSTIGNSDPNVQTAYNLAFGRPPVCVLRIGDFYYTKIIINSLTINYDEPQWDLNPEGIGVMPMFAKVNIDFNFIGGSDLAGPIARLQNAVSFNYYANASVYDNRAERVEYDPTGTGKEVAYKPYNYPTGPGRHVAGTTDKDGKFIETDSDGIWEDI